MTNGSNVREVEAVRELIARSERLWLARNLDAYVALYDGAVVMLWPNQAPIVGKEATRSCYEGMLERLEYLEMRHDIEEIEVAGSWAFVWGFGSGTTIAKASGERREFKTKFLNILRKQADGSWAYCRTCMSF